MDMYRNIYVLIYTCSNYTGFSYLTTWLETVDIIELALPPKVTKLIFYPKRCAIFWNVCQNNFPIFFSYGIIFILSFLDLRFFRRNFRWKDISCSKFVLYFPYMFQMILRKVNCRKEKSEKMIFFLIFFRKK